MATSIQLRQIKKSYGDVAVIHVGAAALPARRRSTRVCAAGSVESCA